MISKPIKVKARYLIWLKFEDGTEGEINLSQLAGKGVFRKWEKSNFFNKVYIDKQSNSIAWDDIIQLCPNTLYMKLKKNTFHQWNSQRELHGTNM